MEANNHNVRVQMSNCFVNWENSISIDHSTDPFESALSSIVSSPVASAMGPGDGDNGMMLKELIGRLGVICNSGEVSPHSYLEHRSTNHSTNASSYTTPLNSPPNLRLSMMVHRIRGDFAQHIPQLSQESFPPFSTDPEFSDRAARFSCFRSKGFSGGGLNGHFSSNGSQTLARENGNGETGDSQEGSSLSEQIPSGQTSKLSTKNDAIARKRKSDLSGKSKDLAAGHNDSGVAGENHQPSLKKIKPGEDKDKGRGKESDGGDEEVMEEGKNKKQGKDDKSKPPEPLKDYIHVRARRGQATDSHSLAERVRREKISQRMKVLQDLVPGCNKITGKALMLDEIINYVQSLQRQVEFLSMKLATLNPRMDINMDAFLSKDIFDSSAHSAFPMNSSSAHSFPYNFQPPHGMITSSPELQFAQNPLNDTMHTNPSIHLPQVSAMWEDDLQSIVQLGISQNNLPLSFNGSLAPSHLPMKVKPNHL